MSADEKDGRIRIICKMCGEERWTYAWSVCYVCVNKDEKKAERLLREKD